MLQTFQLVAGCAPSQHKDVYIFTVAPAANHGLAAITSADELILLDRDSLSSDQVSRILNVSHGTSSLVVTDQGQTAICGGSDGTLTLFDLRVGSLIARFNHGKPHCDTHISPSCDSSEPLILGKSINTLACAQHDIALGSESVVSVW